MGIGEEMAHRGKTDSQEDAWLVAVVQDRGMAMDPDILLGVRKKAPFLGHSYS